MTETASRAQRPGGVPAARQTLALLQALARQPGAVPAAVLARDLALPRSTTYHLLAELMAAGFVVHLPEERRYGLGVSAFEIGSAYSRQEPLAPLARPLLAPLLDAVAPPSVGRGRPLRAPGRAAGARGALRRGAARPRPAAAGHRRRRPAARTV